MSSETQELQKLANQEYKYGFFTEVETDTVPAGLNEDVVRLISGKKKEPEFLLDWRLKAYRHWLRMEEPRWAFLNYPSIDYQDMVYYFILHCLYSVWDMCYLSLSYLLDGFF